MLRTRTATGADIRDVVASLSAMSAGDMAGARYSIEDLTNRMLGRSTQGEAVAFVRDDALVAIVIFVEEDLNVLGMSFIGTDGFFQGGWQPTRFLRKYIDARMKARPGVALVAVGYSRDPDLARWYQLLGYGNPATDGICFTYVRQPE